jgi:hypothetical protein
MDGVYRVRIKIGTAEFEAEGREELVKEHYEEFLDSFGGSQPTGDVNQTTVIEQRKTSSEANGDLIKRGFLERDGLVTLLALPKGDEADADALVLLLYGYSVLKADDYPVTGVRLMQAAQRSGVQLDRIDRPIASREQYVLTTGFRRGRRYSLNNRGEQFAAQLLEQLFD